MFQFFFFLLFLLPVVVNKDVHCVPALPRSHVLTKLVYISRTNDHRRPSHCHTTRLMDAPSHWATCLIPHTSNAISIWHLLFDSWHSQRNVSMPCFLPLGMAMCLLLYIVTTLSIASFALAYLALNVIMWRSNRRPHYTLHPFVESFVRLSTRLSRTTM